MAKIPDADEYRRQWSQLDRDARRRVTRATNLVRRLDDPREAALAVRLASSQRRFWRLAWPFAPVLIALFQIGQGWEAMIANALVGLVLFGGMGFFFIRRAARAEALNRVVAESGARKRHPEQRADKPKKKKGRSGGRGNQRPKGSRPSKRRH